MRETELPSVTKPQFNSNSYLMSYKIVVPVEICRQKAIIKYGSILDVALKLYSTKMISLKKANTMMNKREREINHALKVCKLEAFKDNRLCKAFVKPKKYPRKFWRGGTSTNVVSIIDVIKELAFFIKYIERPEIASRQLDKDYVMLFDDDENLLTELIAKSVEKNRLAKNLLPGDHIDTHGIRTCIPLGLNETELIEDKEEIERVGNNAMKNDIDIDRTKVDEVVNKIDEEANVESDLKASNLQTRISSFFGSFYRKVTGVATCPPPSAVSASETSSSSNFLTESVNPASRKAPLLSVASPIEDFDDISHFLAPEIEEPVSSSSSSSRSNASTIRCKSPNYGILLSSSSSSSSSSTSSSGPSTNESLILNHILNTSKFKYASHSKLQLQALIAEFNALKVIIDCLL
jgi:hypothetical protein